MTEACSFHHSAMIILVSVDTGKKAEEQLLFNQCAFTNLRIFQVILWKRVIYVLV